MSRQYNEKLLSNLPQVLNQLEDVKSYDTALGVISGIAKELAIKNISTSRLRNIYNHVHALSSNEDGLKELKRLRYLLAYTAARERNKFFRKVVEKIDKIIVNIKEPGKITLFQQFMEALIAYHRFYGGQE